MSDPEDHHASGTHDDSKSTGTSNAPRARLSEIAKKLREHLAKQFAEILVLAIVIVVLSVVYVLEHHEILNLWKGLWNSGRTKVVLAVFPHDSTGDPIKKGLGLEKNDEIELTPGVNLRLVTERETIRGTEAEVKNQLKDPNVILVIGHYSSTTAEKMLEDVYEADSDHPIPLILPAVTNPDITKDPPNDIKHVLRLPSSDTTQVNELVTLLNQLTANGNRREGQVLLVVDRTNQTYSGFIARELLKNLPNLFVDSIGVGIDGEGFRPARYRDSQPKVIVFVGMENQGMLFLKLMSESKWPKSQLPALVFTDGVAGNGFRPLAEEVAAKDFDGSHFRIFVTAPIPTTLPKGANLGDNFPNYEAMGQASKRLATSLVERAKKSYGEITRQSVLDTIKDVEKSREDLGSDGLALKLEFDNDGNDSSGGVHVYEIRGDGAYHSCDCFSYADNSTPCSSKPSLSPRLAKK